MSGSPRIFVFGLGYTALALERALEGKVSSFHGTTRSAESAAALKARGIDAVVFDGSSPGQDVAAALGEATHVLVSVAPGEADPIIAHHRREMLAAPALQWIGYLSSVAVYGNYGGAWVSEATTPHPVQRRSTERLAAEKAWKNLATEKGVPLAVFRLAGIYGPGRNALVNLAAGSAHRVVKHGQVFNRIHIDDIATGVAAALDRDAGGIFNLADDAPAPPQDVVTFAAGLMGVAPPPEVPLETAELSPMARSFYADNKRVANARLKRDLAVTLRYPTYREGLTVLWEDGTWRG